MKNYANMAHVVNGKLYNPATAKRLLVVTGGSEDDGTYYEEALFLKQNKEFFLLCRGMGNSIYGHCVAEYERTDGCSIHIIGPNEVRRWLERNVDWGSQEADIICEVLGDSDMPIVLTDVRVDDENLYLYAGEYVHDNIYGYEGDRTYRREMLTDMGEGKYRLYVFTGEKIYRDIYSDDFYYLPSQILTWTIEDAKKWMEQHGNYTRYLAVFGEVSE